MEALAAVGLASNILQFIEAGYKVLSASKEMYGSGHEAGQSNKDIETITQEMKRLGLSLSKGVPALQKTEEDEALLRLTAECERWSNDMLALLDHLRNKNPNSKLKAIKAGWKNYRKQGERDRLEKGLDSCRKQLALQLTSMSRSDTLSKLQDLSDSAKLNNDNLVTLKRNLELLQTSLPDLSTSVTSQFLDGVRKILQVSDEALRKSKQELFLSAIEYQGMEDRFYYVESAHAATFEWILADSPVTNTTQDPSVPKLFNFREQARKDFIHWLESGRGIFHISGKPGSGKSTLMKFLFKNESTRRYLKQWSGGKPLIFAKSFFWRLGNDRQKSLSGLIHTLLYEVLSTTPDLIPIAFPSLWVAVEPSTKNGSRLTRTDIEQGFENLLANQSTFEKHKMVFFIDGLDEFSGRHTELVNKFFNWTANSEHLKICVASREWNEFMEGFAECPRLRIHQCTHGDVTTLVDDRLKTIRPYLDVENDGELERLSENITYKAEGVFQWVRLVLNAVEDGAINGDSVSDLKSKVDAFPNELKELYQYLFDSIHIADRQKVFETLRMTQHMGLDRKLPLLRFWFLNKVIDDPDYAMKTSITENSEESITKILKITRRQIYGRCKGFLEVHPPLIRDPYDRPPEFWPSFDDGEVGFMHSTAQEFLDQSHIKQLIDQVVGHVDFFDRICQTFLASVKFADQAWYFRGYNNSVDDTPFNEELIRVMEFAVNTAQIFTSRSPKRQDRFLKFLDELDTTAASRLGLESTSSYNIQWEIGYVARNRRFRCYTPPRMHVQTFAMNCLIHEFFRDKDPTYMISTAAGKSAKDDDGNDASDFTVLMMGQINPADVRDGTVDYVRLCSMLEFCFSRGISPNYISPAFNGLSLFDLMLIWFIYHSFDRMRYSYEDLPPGTFIHPLRLVELFLRYGARSQIQICLDAESPCEDEGLIAAQLNIAGKNIFNEALPGVKEWFCLKSSAIAVFARRRNWAVTIRDLMELWFPKHHEILQRLIDRNACDTDSGLQLPPRELPSSIQDEPEQPWSAVELGEDIFQWHQRELGDKSKFRKLSSGVKTSQLFPGLPAPQSLPMISVRL
ncbi:hypothetical protein M434DRAFT_393992 [Hypoxylon sp. CO27-5]|nr:hypothetical protein M434DRAFT_393992 [Hypoxylon sp. CO27-5]